MRTSYSDRRPLPAEPARKSRLLLVEDEPALRFSIAEFFREAGYEVLESSTFTSAFEQIRSASPDLVLMDYRLPDGDALSVLPRLRQEIPEAGVVVLTGHGTIDLAVRAIQSGADHFFSKPVQLEELESTLGKLDRQRRLERARRADRRNSSRRMADPFRGSSPLIRSLEREATRVAASQSPILITGPTGSGKGLLANWLHNHGPRAEEPFVDVNCASLTREFLESELFGHERGAFTGAVATKTGLFEVAHRGTLFLDEVGDMPLEIQPRLLKVLEERRFRRMGGIHDRTVDVRIIAATHHDLAARADEGTFREDLYFRIQTLPLRVPALRERLEDLPELAQAILGALAEESGRPMVPLRSDVLERLRCYDWPGNFRELRNVLERALLLSEGGEIALRDLGVVDRHARDQAPSGSTEGNTLRQLERRAILQALDRCGRRVAEAAVSLGIPRSTLYQKMQRFGILAARTRIRPRQLSAD